MTFSNWIGVGIATILVLAFIGLNIYIKRKKDQYDGLGGLIKKGKPTRKLRHNKPTEDTEPNKND